MVRDGSPVTAPGLHAQDCHWGDVRSANGSSGGGSRLGAADVSSSVTLYGSPLLAGSPLSITPAAAAAGGGGGSLSGSFGAPPGNIMPDLPGACALLPTVPPCALPSDHIHSG